MVQRSMAQEAAELKSFSPMQTKFLPGIRVHSVWKRTVRFQSIQIRHYERILGDHPSCSSGAPIGIGWNYFLDERLTVEEFEGDRRTSGPLVALNKEQRHDLLLAWGVKKNELVCSVRKNLKAKQQRRRTVNSSTRYDRWEEAVESASRKIKKSFQWTSVFSPEPSMSRREATFVPTCSTSPPFISASTTKIPEATSRVMLSSNFDKTATVKEPSASNAQKPTRPPASPLKIVPRYQDESSRDSFPKIALDPVMFDVSAGSRGASAKYYGGEEDEDIVSIFDDSSSSSTEYTDSEEENFVSISDSSSSSAIDTRLPCI